MLSELVPTALIFSYSLVIFFTAINTASIYRLEKRIDVENGEPLNRRYRTNIWYVTEFWELVICAAIIVFFLFLVIQNYPWAVEHKIVVIPAFLLTLGASILFSIQIIGGTE